MAPSSRSRKYPTAALILISKRLHNHNCPISRLPTELCLIIIDLATRHLRERRSLSLITSPIFRFCHRWREAALHNPLLWTFIATTSRYEADIMVQRSAACALSVIAPSASVLGALLPFSHRWTQLGIGSEITGSMFEEAYSADAPKLATALILSHGRPISRHLFSGTAGMLRRLEVDFFLPISDPIWCQLVSLKITSAGVLQVELWKMVAAWENLECLVLDDCYISDRIFLTSAHALRPNITPPRLRYIRFSSTRVLSPGGVQLLLFLCNLISSLASLPPFLLKATYEVTSGELGVDHLFDGPSQNMSLLSLLSISDAIGLSTDQFGWTLRAKWGSGANLELTCEHSVEQGSLSTARYLYRRLSRARYSDLQRLYLFGLDDSFPTIALLPAMPFLRYLRLGPTSENAPGIIQQLTSSIHVVQSLPCLIGLRTPENQLELTQALPKFLHRHPMSTSQYLYLTFDHADLLATPERCLTLP